MSLMMGVGHYDAHTGLLVGPVPWGQVAAWVLVAAV
jgi:hypothetical protein